MTDHVCSVAAPVRIVVVSALKAGDWSFGVLGVVAGAGNFSGRALCAYLFPTMSFFAGILGRGQV